MSLEQQLHLDAFGAVYRFFNYPSGTFLFYMLLTVLIVLFILLATIIFDI